MINYKADYTLCTNSRKEVYHGICRHCIKNTYMYCNLKKDFICPAWKDYKYKED